MGLGESLREALRKFSGKSFVDESSVKELMKEIQRILIAGDVEVKLVFNLTKKIEERVLKETGEKKISLREHVAKVLYEELVLLLGGEKHEPSIQKKKILLLGLYGSGKTTTCGKLALFYKKKGLSASLVALDFDRPAARDQLKQLSEKIGCGFYSSGNTSIEAAKHAVATAKEEIIIFDTAGRSAFDAGLADEIISIAKIANPDEIYLVVSADIGKVARKHAEEFAKCARLSGVIVTKAEGSGKGGGALSSVASLLIPVSFIGTGEKLEALEVFDAKKFVGKLLGIPDLQGLLEKVKKAQEETQISEDDFEELTVDSFFKQLKATKSMGPIGDVLSSLGMSDIPKDMLRKSEDEMKKIEAIVNSMSKQERKNAELVLKSRSRTERIAKGSGTRPEDVRKFLDQFFKMSKMMNRFKKDRNLKRKLEGMMKGGNFSGAMKNGKFNL